MRDVETCGTCGQDLPDLVEGTIVRNKLLSRTVLAIVPGEGVTRALTAHYGAAWEQGLRVILITGTAAGLTDTWSRANCEPLHGTIHVAGRA